MADSVHHEFTYAAKAVRSWAQEELTELGLHVGQDLLLLALYEEDGRTPGELAERLTVDPSVISKMLSRMESEGLVVRRSDSDDARIKRVFLTDDGRSLRGRVEDFHRRAEERMLEGFSAEEKPLFRRMLASVHDNFSESDRSPSNE